MYQLIAAIVAIAIGVASAASGIYYAGTAYTAASAKAQAVQIISALEQIDAAWSMWEGDSNTTSAAHPTGYVVGTGAGDLQAANSQGFTYLQSWPTAPSQAVTWGAAPATTGAAVYAVDRTTPAGKLFVGTFVVLAAGAGASTGALAACTQIAQMSGMVAAGATLAGTTITVALNAVDTVAHIGTVLANYKFGCFGITAGGAWALPLGQDTFQAGDTTKFVAYFRHT